MVIGQACSYYATTSGVQNSTTECQTADYKTGWKRPNPPKMSGEIKLTTLTGLQVSTSTPPQKQWDFPYPALRDQDCFSFCRATQCQWLCARLQQYGFNSNYTRNTEQLSCCQQMTLDPQTLQPTFLFQSCCRVHPKSIDWHRPSPLLYLLGNPISFSPLNDTTKRATVPWLGPFRFF